MFNLNGEYLASTMINSSIQTTLDCPALTFDLTVSLSVFLSLARSLSLANLNEVSYGSYEGWALPACLCFASAAYGHRSRPRAALICGSCVLLNMFWVGN